MIYTVSISENGTVMKLVNSDLYRILRFQGVAKSPTWRSRGGVTRRDSQQDKPAHDKDEHILTYRLKDIKYLIKSECKAYRGKCEAAPQETPPQRLVWPSGQPRGFGIAAQTNLL